MKTKEELNALKGEVKALNKKLAELTEDELKQVTGGEYVSFVDSDDYTNSQAYETGAKKPWYYSPLQNAFIYFG